VGKVPVSVREVPAGGVPEGKSGKLGMLDLVVKKDHEQEIADIIAPNEGGSCQVKCWLLQLYQSVPTALRIDK
jgi:hypothetical protein